MRDCRSADGPVGRRTPNLQQVMGSKIFILILDDLDSLTAEQG